MNTYLNRSYFFDHGIRFQCRQCGACCTGAPGTVYVTTEELTTIAHFLDIPIVVLREHYVYPFRDSLSIAEDIHGNCVFYHPSQGCTIYSVRPNQCRYYPFWWKNLRNEKNWHLVASQCPGIGSGTLYTKENILEFLQHSVI